MSDVYTDPSPVQALRDCDGRPATAEWVENGVALKFAEGVRGPEARVVPLGRRGRSVAHAEARGCVQQLLMEARAEEGASRGAASGPDDKGSRNDGAFHQAASQRHPVGISWTEPRRVASLNSTSFL